MITSDDDQPAFICEHLVASPEHYHVWFTGQGKECFWVCAACAKQYPEPPGSLIEFNTNLIGHHERKMWWSGICGKPEIRHRESLLRFAHAEYPLPFLETDRLIDIQPDLQKNGKWFTLRSSGELGVISFRPDEFQVLHRVSQLDFEIDEETGLCVSPGNEYAAIYQASDRHACILELRSGQMTAQVDRGDYRPENSQFPIAFFEFEGRPLLVAATDWNRLDIFDPASGTVLTERETASWRNGEQHPEHDLDYFHAQIMISPDSDWIADNGWHWHPWGVVRSWNLVEWLRRNLWESEDGDSCRELAGRAYYWDGPLCWIDNSTLAVWGWGNDDEWLIPAVRLFDVRSGQETQWFAGPETRRPSACPPKKLAKSLYFDQFLVSVHDEIGTGVWDIKTGERLLCDSSFAPINYHPGSKDFLSLTANGIRLSTLIS